MLRFLTDSFSRNILTTFVVTFLLERNFSRVSLFNFQGTSSLDSSVSCDSSIIIPYHFSLVKPFSVTLL